MRCWRMLAVSKGQGCLPWIAQAEMREKCLIALLLLITGLSLSTSLTCACVHTQKEKNIYMAIVIGKRVVWHGFGKPAWSILCLWG